MPANARYDLTEGCGKVPTPATLSLTTANFRISPILFFGLKTQLALLQPTDKRLVMGKKFEAT